MINQVIRHKLLLSCIELRSNNMINKSNIIGGWYVSDVLVSNKGEVNVYFNAELSDELIYTLYFNHLMPIAYDNVVGNSDATEEEVVDRMMEAMRDYCNLFHHHDVDIGLTNNLVDEVCDQLNISDRKYVLAAAQEYVRYNLDTDMQNQLLKLYNDYVALCSKPKLPTPPRAKAKAANLSMLELPTLPEEPIHVRRVTDVRANIEKDKSIEE